MRKRVSKSARRGLDGLQKGGRKTHKIGATRACQRGAGTGKEKKGMAACKIRL